MNNYNTHHLKQADPLIPPFQIHDWPKHKAQT